MSDPNRDPGADPAQTRRPAMVPRWVKVFAVTAAVLAVALLLVMLFGGGSHGPRRHLSLSVDAPTAGPFAAVLVLGPEK